MQASSSLNARPAAPRKAVGFGIALIVIGSIVLLRALDILSPFQIDLGFPFIMIAIAAVVAFRSRFRNPVWILLLLIGVAHAIPEFDLGGVESDEIAVAVGLIMLGAYVVRRKRWQQPVAGYDTDWRQSEKVDPFAEQNTAYGPAQEGPFHLNTFSLFAGRKEIITSKEFRGGRVASVFGGTELNLMNADSPASTIVVDVTAVCGGVDVIIPSNWQLVNQVDAIFGGVEDNRSLRTAPTEGSKTIVLRGFCLMGGVEIKSF